MGERGTTFDRIAGSSDRDERPWRCRLLGCDLPDVFINVYNDSRPRCRRCGREQSKASNPAPAAAAPSTVRDIPDGI